jgi:alcohol dehydrogenase class IV
LTCAHDTYGLRLGGADYLAPRQVLSGPESSGLVGASLRSFGSPTGKVFVVADRVVAGRGLTERLLAGLREADLHPVVFSDISGEPTTEELSQAVRLARQEAAVAVVGIGGGSSMDAAKLVALLLTNKGEVDDWIGAVIPSRPVAPLALVPTTVGTGSEVTRIAMVTKGDRKQITSCAQFVPLVVALDSDMVASLPASVVASTGMDALAHALESLLSTNRNALTVAAATKAASLVLDNIELATESDGYEARTNMLLGAYFAGLALNAGVVLGHSLAYVIARRAHLPHGTTCALALPYCLAYDRNADPVVVEQVARVATQGESGEMWEAVSTIDALVERLGLPRSLAEVAIDIQNVESMAEECIRDYPRPNNPVPLDSNGITQLIRAMHYGDLSSAFGRTA